MRGSEDRDVATEQETFRRSLEWARGVVPQGTLVRDTSSPFADYTLEFELVTEFESRVAPALAEHSTFVRTKGMWNARLSAGDSWDEVRRAVGEHFRTLGEVYSDRLV